jgi:prepilin-type N-terminal cleavage/methylation domain-containing protein
MFKNLKSSDWSDKSVAEQGFTLIELLVVIAILGILAVVGVLSFNGLTGGAHTAVNQTELTQVQTASDAFMAKNNGTPAVDTAALQGAGLLRTGVNAVKCAYTINQGPGATTGDVTQGVCP